MTKELSSNTLPYAWIVNDLLLTIYPNISDYYKDREPSMANVLIKTYNHGYQTYKLNNEVKLISLVFIIVGFD